MDIYLPIAGQSVNALLIIALGGLVGISVRNVRRGRRLSHHAAADLLRNSADRSGRIGDDADHRRKRHRRHGASAQGRCGPADGRRHGRRRPHRLAGRSSHLPRASGERPDRRGHRLALRPPARLHRLADAQGRARSRLGLVPTQERPSRGRATIAGSPRFRFAGASTSRVSISLRSRHSRSASGRAFSPCCSASAAGSSSFRR